MEDDCSLQPRFFHSSLWVFQFDVLTLEFYSHSLASEPGRCLDWNLLPLFLPLAFCLNSLAMCWESLSESRCLSCYWTKIWVCVCLRSWASLRGHFWSLLLSFRSRLSCCQRRKPRHPSGLLLWEESFLIVLDPPQGPQARTWGLPWGLIWRIEESTVDLEKAVHIAQLVRRWRQSVVWTFLFCWRWHCWRDLSRSWTSPDRTKFNPDRCTPPERPGSHTPYWSRQTTS